MICLPTQLSFPVSWCPIFLNSTQHMFYGQWYSTCPGMASVSMLQLETHIVLNQSICCYIKVIQGIYIKYRTMRKINKMIAIKFCFLEIDPCCIELCREGHVAHGFFPTKQFPKCQGSVLAQTLKYMQSSHPDLFSFCEKEHKHILSPKLI